MRRSLVEIRALKTVNKAEIDKFCSVAEGASKVMVILLINDEATEDEASQEVSHEMKRQYFQKIQDFQYDPKRPEFFVCTVKNCDEEVAPGLDLFPGTVLGLFFFFKSKTGFEPGLFSTAPKLVGRLPD